MTAGSTSVFTGYPPLGHHLDLFDFDFDVDD